MNSLMKHQLTFYCSHAENDKYSVSVKDAAVRTLISAVCTKSDHYWIPLQETIRTFPRKESQVAFRYIIHQFLAASRYVSLTFSLVRSRSREVPVSNGSQISSENQDWLRQMEQRAVSRNLSPSHPIDRLVILFQRVMNVQSVAVALDKAGIPDLLRVLEMGHYDFLADQPLTASEREERERAAEKIIQRLERVRLS